MRLIAKVIRISHAKFRCSRLTTVQDSQDYASLIFLAHSVVYMLRVFFCALLCMVQSLRRTSYS